MQIFHNTIMTGLIHKTITRTTITELFGLDHLKLVKMGWARGQADKKFDILTFSTSTYSKQGKTFLSHYWTGLFLELFGLQFKTKIFTGNEVGCERV